MIKLTAIGHIGRDAVLNQINGKSVINFTVAHSEKFKDAQGNQKEKTTWVDCSYWTEKNGIAPYLKKGTQVYVEGQPDVRSYTTKDGVHGATLSLRVSGVQLLGNKQQDAGGAPQQSSGANSYTPAGPVGAPPIGVGADMNEPFDDLPF